MSVLSAPPRIRRNLPRCGSIFIEARFDLGGLVEERNDRLRAERHAAVGVVVEIVELRGLEHAGSMRGL